MMDPLPVIFRMHRGELAAYFPTKKWNRAGTRITCYTHIGQHGEACPTSLRSGRPATPEEYAPLLAELRGIYETQDDEHIPLRVYKRATGRAALR